jgi:hypothetical protein
MPLHPGDEIKLGSSPSKPTSIKSSPSTSPRSLKGQLCSLNETMRAQNAEFRELMAQQREEFRAMFVLLLERTKPADISSSPLPPTSDPTKHFPCPPPEIVLTHSVPDSEPVQEPLPPLASLVATNDELISPTPGLSIISASIVLATEAVIPTPEECPAPATQQEPADSHIPPPLLYSCLYTATPIPKRIACNPTLTPRIPMLSLATLAHGLVQYPVNLQLVNLIPFDPGGF